MIYWIFAALVVYVVHIYLPVLLFLPAEGFFARLGARDKMPEPSALAGRARRALVNLQENLPIFLTLAILAMIVTSTKTDLAVSGAMVFVLARAAYLPLYLISIPGLRSLAYLVSVIGLIMMIWALV
jgi:uncharacterized MAPEG superfamily protein